MVSLVEQIKRNISADSESLLPVIFQVLERLNFETGQLRHYVESLEQERQSLRALAQIGQVVNSTLELDEVL